MARQKRFCPAGIAQHVIQRGNNRQICFGSEEDFAVYINWLKEYAQKFEVHVHAWVLMTNHVHLLLTPQVNNGVSMLMQSVGRRYVQYFNRRYKRSGTLWEGRFKSCVVQAQNYLLQCYRYIELNPVRANMVVDPGEYAWSSYRVNALEGQSELCTPHPEYLALGKEEQARKQAYRGLFDAHIDRQAAREIRKAVNLGMALGSERFKDELEALHALRLRPGRPGRPRANEDW